MKIKNILISTILINFLILSAMLLSSCDIKSPVEGLEVRLQTISRETTVNLFIKDAVDNSVIRQNVTVTFEGANSNNIIDVNNNSQTTFTTSSGFITFSVKDGTSFNENSPFEVNAKLESSGYNTVTSPVNIFSKGISSSTLFMVNPSNVQTITTTGDATGGSTDSSGVVASDTTTTTTSGVAVSLTSGTTLTTSTGAPLVGTLTTSVQTVPLTNNNIAPPTVSGSGTNAIPVMQVTVNITDQSGNSAANISNDIELEIPIGATDINPSTGQAYQVGEKVTLFILNDNTGASTKVGEGEIISTSGGLAIKATIAAGSLGKLRKVNVVAGAVIVAANDDSGNDPCKVVLKSTQQDISSYSFEVFIDGRSKGSFSGSQFLSSGGVAFNNILTPANVEVKYQGTSVLSASIECGNNNLTFNLSAIPQTFTINFAASGVCRNQDPAVIGTLADAAYTYYPTNNVNDVNTGVVTGGSGSATLSPGTYTIEITYDGDTYSGNVTISSSGVVSQSGFDTSNLYFGEININGTPTTLTSANNPNIQGTSITVYVSIDCN